MVPAREQDHAGGVRVMIVDPHELFRRGLRALLEVAPGVDVVGDAGDADAAVAMSRALEPEVVLIEIRLPGHGGAQAVRDILSGPPPAPKVVMLTSSEDGADLCEAVKAGAAGYLLKDTSVHELTEALGAVTRGNSPIAPSMASKLLSEFSALAADGAGREQGAALTGRELEVLTLVARGLSNKEAAAELFIAENTVKNHVRNILEKLRLHSRMQAVMYAVREGLIRPDGR